MIELYHYWNAVCGQKSRLCVVEKGIAWQSHHVNLFRGDGLDPEYLAINPNGVVPTLVHDGRVIVESSIINEYLDDVFPEPILKPGDAYLRAEMRGWCKFVDNFVHSATRVASFNQFLKPSMEWRSDAEMEAYLARIPSTDAGGTRDRHRRFREGIRKRLPDEETADSFNRLERVADRMESDLASHGGPWLVGADYSLADVSMAPYVHRLEQLGVSRWWQDGNRPRLADWYTRLKERPAFQEAFCFYVPDELPIDRPFGPEMIFLPAEVKARYGLEAGV